jgi:hypothetical protein
LKKNVEIKPAGTDAQGVFWDGKNSSVGQAYGTDVGTNENIFGLGRVPGEMVLN